MKQNRGNPVLTETLARHIKFKLARPVVDGGEGRSVAEIAQVYGVCRETVRRLLRGETWGDLKDEALPMQAEFSAETLAKAEESAAKLHELMKGE